MYLSDGYCTIWLHNLLSGIPMIKFELVIWSVIIP